MSSRIYLVLILALAMALRLSVLGQESLWYDELHSIQNSQPTPMEIIAHVEYHMPLYFILLHYWMDWLPGDEFHLRLLSALFGIAGVGSIYIWGRALRLSNAVCLWGALLYAASPHAIYYSYEVRMYSLLPLLGHLHFALTGLVFSLPHPKRTGISTRPLKRNYSQTLLISGWFFLGISIAWTHFYGIFFFIAEGMWALVLSQRLRRIYQIPRWIQVRRLSKLSFLKPVVSVILLSVCASLSIAPFIARLVKNSNNGYGILGNYYTMTWMTPWDVFDRLVNGPMFESAPSYVRVLSTCGFLCLVVTALFPLYRLLRGRTILNRDLRWLVPGLVAMAIVGSMVGISYWRQIILGGHRYLTIAVGPLCLAAALGIDRLWKKEQWHRLICIAIVSCVGLSQFLYLFDFYRDREHPTLREAAAYVISHAQPGDTVITRPAFDQDVIDYYTKKKIPSYSWRRLMAMSPTPARVWVITTKERYIWEESVLQAAGWRMKEPDIPHRYRTQDRINRFEWGQLRSTEPPGVLLNREEDMQTGVNCNDYVSSSRGLLSYQSIPNQLSLLSQSGELFVQPGVQSVQLIARDGVESVTLAIPVRTGFDWNHAPRINDHNGIVGSEGGNSFLNALTPGGQSIAGHFSPTSLDPTEAIGSHQQQIALGEFSLEESREAGGMRIRSSTAFVHAESIGDVSASYQGLTVRVDSNGHYALSADRLFSRPLQVVLNRTVRMIAAPAYYPSLAEPEIYPASGYALGNVVCSTDSLHFHLEANQGLLTVLPGLPVTQGVTLSANYSIQGSTQIRIALLGVNRMPNGEIQLSNGYGYTQVTGSLLAVGIPRTMTTYCLPPKGFVNPAVQIVNSGTETADVEISRIAMMAAPPLTDLALNPNRIVPTTPDGDFSLREDAEQGINDRGILEEGLDVFDDRQVPFTQGKVIASCDNCSIVCDGPGSLLLDPKPDGKALVILQAIIQRGTVTVDIHAKRILNTNGTLRLLVYSEEGEFETCASIQTQDLLVNQWKTVSCSGVCQTDQAKLNIAIQVSDGDALIGIDDVTVRQIEEPRNWFDRNYFE